MGACRVRALGTEVNAIISLCCSLAGSGFGIWSGPPTGGWADAALTEDVTSPSPERGSPRTLPATAAGLCSTYGVDGPAGKPDAKD